MELDLSSKWFFKKVETILNNPKTNSAVLICLGSIAETPTMLLPMKMAFVKAFLRFSDIQFIWKFSRNESDHFENELFSSAPNVHPFEWVEQKAILGNNWLLQKHLLNPLHNVFHIMANQRDGNHSIDHIAFFLDLSYELEITQKFSFFPIPYGMKIE